MTPTSFSTNFTTLPRPPRVYEVTAPIGEAASGDVAVWSRDGRELGELTIAAGATARVTETRRIAPLLPTLSRCLEQGNHPYRHPVVVESHEKAGAVEAPGGRAAPVDRIPHRA
jgi:hypothetical protein